MSASSGPSRCTREARQRASLLSIAVLSSLAVLAIAFLPTSASAGAEEPDIQADECQSGVIGIAQPLYAKVKNTESPGRQFGQFIAERAKTDPQFVGALARETLATDTRRDLKIVSKTGQVLGLLSYRNDATLGWHVDTLLECQP